MSYAEMEGFVGDSPAVRLPKEPGPLRWCRAGLGGIRDPLRSRSGVECGIQSAFSRMVLVLTMVCIALTLTFVAAGIASAVFER